MCSQATSLTQARAAGNRCDRVMSTAAVFTVFVLFLRLLTGYAESSSLLLIVRAAAITRWSFSRRRLRHRHKDNSNRRVPALCSMHPLRPPPRLRAPHARFSCNSLNSRLRTRFYMHRRRLPFVLTPWFSAACPSHFRRITRINVAIGKRLLVLRASV